MKIRTDFVTNSSSSSFVLTLRIKFRDGEEAIWQGSSDCEEPLTAKKSPSELAESSSIDELIEMIETSIGIGVPNEYQGEVDPVIYDDDEVIEKIRQHGSMDAIKSITVEGYEDNLAFDVDEQAKDQIITYDFDTKAETGIEYGVEDWIICEGNGGSLDFYPMCKHLDTPDGYFEKKREYFSSQDEEWEDEDEEWSDDEEE